MRMPIQEGKHFLRENGYVEDSNSIKKILKRNTDDNPEISSVKKVKREGNVPKPGKVKDLSPNVLKEGMIILGCVQEVSANNLEINLPGQIIGCVPASNISDEYDVYLEKHLGGKEKVTLDLTNMFKPGQIVVTSVKEISELDNGELKVTLTLKPYIIYHDMSVNDVRNGLTLSAAVQSIEDKGYQMNCGISGVKAFLRKSQSSKLEDTWNDGRSLGVGQVIRCLATKLKNLNEGIKMHLLADPETVANQQITETDMPLKSVFIGLLLPITISKITSSGLVVKFFDDKTGYVHSNYVKMDYRTLNVGDTLLGRVLYIEPITEKIYLSVLENICGIHPPCPFKTIKKEQILKKAKVVSSKGRHLLLELDENRGVFGYVMKQYLDANEVDTEQKFSDFVKEKYPEGSLHVCKVLKYDYLMQKYSCSLTSNVMEQQISNVDEIAPGVVAECKVIKSSLKKIILKMGSFKGIVDPIHCCDVPVNNPHMLLHKGQKVKAKVLSVKNPLCDFTLKSSLVDSQNPILTGFSDAKCYVPYDGVVVSITEEGLLVKFYGDFETFIPANEVLGDNTVDSTDLFYIGQVVTCFVKEINKDERRLAFKVQPCEENQAVKEESKYNSLKVGTSYIVIVEDISPEGLIVREEVCGVKGWIPTPQLDDSHALAKILYQTFRKDDKIQTYCLNCENEVLFSASPTFIKYFQSSSGKELVEKGSSILKKNSVVPSVIIEIATTGIVVMVPMRREKYLVNVASNDICDGSVDVLSLGLEMHQSIMVQILQVSSEGSSSGSCCFSRVTKGMSMSESGVMLLQSYMNTQKKIHEFWKREGDPIGELGVGSRVEGSVIAVSQVGAVISLKNGVQGIVMPTHYKSLNLEEGMTVEGVVLFVDVLNTCVEISLEREVQETFASLGKAPRVGKQVECFVLVSKPDVVVCSIDCGKRKQIAYVPSRWHINDLYPSPYFNSGDNSEIFIKMSDGDLVLAVPLELEVLERKERNIKTEDKLSMKNTDNVEDFIDKIDGRIIGMEREDAKEKKKKRKIQIIEENIKSEKKEENAHFEVVEPVSHSPLEMNKSLTNECENLSDYGEGVKKKKSNLNINIPEIVTADIEQKAKKKKKKDDQKSSKKNFKHINGELNLEEIEKEKKKNEENLSHGTKKQSKEISTSNIIQSPSDVKHKSQGEQNEKNNRSLKKDNFQNVPKLTNSKSEVSKNRQEKNEVMVSTEFLNVNAGFVWNATPDQLPVVAKQKAGDAVSSSDEEPEVVMNKKKKQRLSLAEKRELARKEEERLRKIEERLMNAERNPVSADDFDRLVMSAPNDSKTWIRYMVYHLEATEVTKARAVAERALKTISFREEEEKFNVWKALLNLENLYGTQETLDKTFEEAVRMNDAYKVHMHALNMFSTSRKLEELDKLVQLVTKKYKDYKNTWLAAGLASIKCGEIEKSRHLMQRALKVLNKKDHIEVLTRFARMENEWGESERAETIMENILTSYPKRIDVWMVFIDMLIKSKKFDAARQVLDRAIIQKLPAMKMKSLFKKYLLFEQEYGSPDKVEKVREMAKSYVENFKS